MQDYNDKGSWDSTRIYNRKTDLDRKSVYHFGVMISQYIIEVQEVSIKDRGKHISPSGMLDDGIRSNTEEEYNQRNSKRIYTYRLSREVTP